MDAGQAERLPEQPLLDRDRLDPVERDGRPAAVEQARRDDELVVLAAQGETAEGDDRPEDGERPGDESADDDDRQHDLDG